MGGPARLEMLVRVQHRIVLGLTAATCLLSPLVVGGAAASAVTYTPLPAHVYAPYYETYLAPNTASIASTAQSSGARYFTLAFLQSAGKHSCSLDWNGNAAQ